MLPFLASLLHAVTCSPSMSQAGVADLCCWHAQMDEEKKAAEGAVEAAETSATDTTTEPFKEAAAIASTSEPSAADKVCLTNTTKCPRCYVYAPLCIPQAMQSSSLLINVRQQKWGLFFMTAQSQARRRFFVPRQLTGQAAAFRRMSMWQEKELGIVLSSVSQGLAAWRRQ